MSVRTGVLYHFHGREIFYFFVRVLDKEMSHGVREWQSHHPLLLIIIIVDRRIPLTTAVVLSFRDETVF